MGLLLVAAAVLMAFRRTADNVQARPVQRLQALGGGAGAMIGAAIRLRWMMERATPCALAGYFPLSI